MSSIRSQEGFTLVEVLVALGVFSIAAMSLAHLGNETLVGARHVDQRFLATVEADNLMAEALVRPGAIPAGVTTGESLQRGRKLSWMRTITATGREGLLAVVVTVSDVETGQQLVNRQTLMRVPAS
jgi:general secretion pathway protein I